MPYRPVAFLCFLLYSASPFYTKATAVTNKINNSDDKSLIEIQITDKNSGEVIIGAFINLESEYGFSDTKGLAYVKWPGGKKAHLIVEYIGMITYRKTVFLDELISENNKIKVELESDSINEALIYADKLRSQSTSISVRLNQNKLKSCSCQNLALTLEQIAGVSSISSGSNIQKPVIQGMHSSRILLINNGVKQEGQQWGADHAPEVDASSAEDIEVIKGAESIRYGSGAIGGVIRLNTTPLPLLSSLSGKFVLKSSSNARGFGFNADLQGGISDNKPLRWRTQMAGNFSGDSKTAEYALNNTGAKDFSFNMAGGTKFNKIKTELFSSIYYTQLGIFYGAHIGNLEDLLERFKVGRPLFINPQSYKINNPKQEVFHGILRWTLDYDMGFAGKIRFQYDFQNNLRNEYELRPGKFSDKPSMGLILYNNSLALNWESDKHIPLRFIVGLNFLSQMNKSRNDTGSVPFIPNYASLSSALYAICKYVKPLYEFEIGGRYDYKYLNSLGYDFLGKEYGGIKHFKHPSFSVSMLLKPHKTVKYYSNLGLAWRGPDVNELYSNGLHHGAAAYQIGDKSLQAESAWKWNNEISFDTKYVKLVGTAFYQWIKNYIFDSPSFDPITGKAITKTLLAGVFPVFKYQQVDARFYGGDISFAINIFRNNVIYTVNAQWIRAINKNTNSYFPYIPSDRYKQQLEFHSNSLLNNIKFIKHISIGLEHSYVTKQKHFDPNNDFIPTTPDAYHLLSFNFAAEIPLKKKSSLEFRLKGLNMLNKLYKEYTNRFRYYSHEKGRDIHFSLTYQF